MLIFVENSNVMKPDTRTQTFRNLFDEWRDISRLSALDAAGNFCLNVWFRFFFVNYSKQTTLELIARDGVDLLIELAGHTANNRLDVCALRPAPHQATYIGYPNTTGLTAVDYRFTVRTHHSITHCTCLFHLVRCSSMCRTRWPIRLTPRSTLPNNCCDWSRFCVTRRLTMRQWVTRVFVCVCYLI